VAAFHLANPVWAEHLLSPSFAKGQQRGAAPEIKREAISDGAAGRMYRAWCSYESR
jgi:hypothetical protein